MTKKTNSRRPAPRTQFLRRNRTAAGGRTYAAWRFFQSPDMPRVLPVEQYRSLYVMHRAHVSASIDTLRNVTLRVKPYDLSLMALRVRHAKYVIPPTPDVLFGKTDRAVHQIALNQGIAVETAAMDGPARSASTKRLSLTHAASSYLVDGVIYYVHALCVFSYSTLLFAVSRRYEDGMIALLQQVERRWTPDHVDLWVYRPCKEVHDPKLVRHLLRSSTEGSSRGFDIHVLTPAQTSLYPVSLAIFSGAYSCVANLLYEKAAKTPQFFPIKKILTALHLWADQFTASILRDQYYPQRLD